MKRTLLASALALASSGALAEEDFWHTSVEGCFIGGGVLGGATALVLYPAATTGAVTVPATTLVIGNTIFGCGLGTIGAMAVYGIGRAQDYLFGEAPPARR